MSFLLLSLLSLLLSVLLLSDGLGGFVMVDELYGAVCLACLDVVIADEVSRIFAAAATLRVIPV